MIEVAAPVGPPVPPPEVPITFKPVASFWDRYMISAHDHALGIPGVLDADRNLYRARLGVESSKIDIGGDRSVVLRFVPQAYGMWHVGGDTLEDPSLAVHEAVLQLHDDGYRLDIGRFEMKYGDELVIGPVDISPSGRAFDGARVHITPAGANYWLDGFFTVLDEGNSRLPPAGPLTEPFAVGDRYFAGVYTGIGQLLTEGLDLDLYMFSLIAPVSEDPMTSAKIDESVRMTWGARAKQRISLVDYRAEVGLQAGQDSDKVDALAYQLDGEVGVNVADDMVRVAGEGFLASADDPTTTDKNEGWNQLFPTTRKWLGYADLIDYNAAGKVVGRNNVAGAVLHLSLAPTSDWKFMLDGHAFVRPERTSGTDALAATEVDLMALYTIGKGLKLRGGYFVFLPSKDHYATSDAIHHAEVELRYDL